MEPELHPIEASRLHARRERVFLVFAGLFLGTLTMLNILGITRFIDLSFTVFGVKIPFVLAVGVLPYPVTFLCTDFIGEFYGRRRANFLVLVGLLLVIVASAVLSQTFAPQVQAVLDNLAYRPFPSPQPYAEVGPIFLCAEPCRRHPDTNVLPRMFQDWDRILVRGYTSHHRIKYGTGQVIDIQAVAPTIEHIFRDGSVAYIHMRSASNNCYQCRVERA